MKKFEYIEAEDLEDLLSILWDFKNEARVIAGGTDLLSIFKDQYLLSYPKLVVNAKPVKELDYVYIEGGILKIGALTRLSTLLSHPLVIEKFPIIKEAIMTIATPQIRNVGTVGGNLCQDIRCWYYRYPARLGGPLICLRKGGKTCLAIRGDNRYHALIGKRCYAVCPSDLAIVLCCLNAEIIVVKKKNQRKLDVQSLYTPLGLSLQPDEIVKEIQVPCNYGFRQRFIKFTIRRPIDFAVLSLAGQLKFEKKDLSKWIITFGGISYRPEVVVVTKYFQKNEKTVEKLLEEIVRSVLVKAKPLTKNAYKIPLLKGLSRKLIHSLM
ncbi:MAG: FAD binding domain-containing protein [Deltaproteobacteria bacterium]|nr:FAD binding domain-containing protein [Deltaproteobacteria bacterium]